MKPAVNFMFQGRKTNAFYLLQSGLTTEGATVTRRKKGYTDYQDIQRLVHAGYLEPRNTGPRGGTRYFTTQAGIEAVNSTMGQS